jgi:hypothetical protein
MELPHTKLTNHRLFEGRKKGLDTTGKRELPHTKLTNHRLLEGRQKGLDTTGKRELPHTQLKKSNTHQVPPANE